MSHPLPFFPKLAFAVLAVASFAVDAAAQIGADTVGQIRQTGRFAGGRDILVGVDAAGGKVCFRREQGDSHRLDIGIATAGAFVRLETPEPRDALPRPPVRAYAGVEEVRNERSTGRFKALVTVKDGLTYIVPARAQGSFVLIAPRDHAPFLAMVAAARGNFLVVEERGGGVRDSAAVYQFDQAAADAILACARRQTP